MDGRRSRALDTEQAPRRQPRLTAVGGARARALGRAAAHLFFGVLPLAFVSAVLVLAHGSEAYGLELRGNLLEPGQRILDGRSPYDPAYPDRVRAQLEAGGEGECCLQALYPPSVHVAAAPLARLPFEAVMAAMALLAIGALASALWLLGVRDWRCYGVTFLAPPVVQGIKLGSLTPFLVLACAAAWHFRDRAVPAGAAVAVAFVAKLFLWPLGVWLLLTRRLRAAASAAAVSLALLLAGSAVVGFGALADYPSLLADLAAIEQESGYSTVAAGMAAGLSSTLARAVALLLVGALLVAAARVDERRAFALAVLASLAATPIVWQSYFTFLVVPVALLAPRLSPVWALPLLFWVLPTEGSGTAHVALGQTALALTAAAVLLRGALPPLRSRQAPRRTPVA